MGKVVGPSFLPYVGFWFLNGEILQEWIKEIQHRPLIVERAVDFSEFEKTCVRRCIKARRWWPLVDVEGFKVYPDLSRMFIANIFDKSPDNTSFFTMIKGKKMHITPTVISLILDIPLCQNSPKLPTNKFNTPNPTAVYQCLTGKHGTLGTHVNPKLLLEGNKVLFHIARTNLCPTLDTAWGINRDMAYFLYLYAREPPFCICSFIVFCFCTYKNSIPFCRVITRILTYFGIHFEDFEESKEFDLPALTQRDILEFEINLENINDSAEPVEVAEWEDYI